MKKQPKPQAINVGDLVHIPLVGYAIVLNWVWRDWDDDNYVCLTSMRGGVWHEYSQNMMVKCRI